MYDCFQDHIVFISGGTSGIGLACARQFIAARARVIIIGRDREKGESAQRSLGAGARFLACDISRTEQLRATFASIEADYGRLDHAVNAAAAAINPALLHETSDAAASQLLHTDVLAQFQASKYQIGLLRKAGGGTIVNLSSVNGLSGVAQAAMYAAGRHALLGLTRSAAREYIGEGIRVNAVCPGATATPRREQRLAGHDPIERAQLEQRVREMIPAGRPADADEIAAAVLWLSSPLSSYVVGHSLVVDGGLSA